MDRKKIIIAIAVFVFLAGGIFYFSEISKVNYLILGAPYNGIYNSGFKKGADSPLITSAMDILGYWGDERFSISDLNNYVYSAQNGDEIVPPDVPGFFKEAGYEVYEWGSAEAGNELKQIKKFVNSEKRTPVIIMQKFSLEPESVAKGTRVVIGVFDKDRKVVTHDYFLGNNYEISYQNFEKMFASDARWILAVWPSDKIKNLIKGPDYSKPYPPRLEVMNKLGPILASKLTNATVYRRKIGDYEKASAAYKDFVNDPSFEYLPAAFQVAILSGFAHTYIYLNQFDEAINVIKERVLPINQNLSEAPPGWFVQPVDKFAYPYYILTLAYFEKGGRDLAINSYREMRLVADSNREILGLGEGNPLEPPPPFMDELQKEISKPR